MTKVLTTWKRGKKNSSYFCLCGFFFEIHFFEKFFLEYFKNANSLDPDQAQSYVGPDLGPNSLQRLSADDTISRQNNYLCQICLT